MSNLDEHIGYVPDAKVGDKVWDDLTSSEATVVEVLLRAYKLDNDYLEGMRHSWEVSRIRDDK